MRRWLLFVFAVLQAAWAAEPEHWLLTFQLAPEMDLTKLTPQQMAVFGEHGKHLATLQAKGLVVGGRTEETKGTLAMIILRCDEAMAKAAVAEDPATRAGYLKSTVHPFALLMPLVLPASLAADGRANYEGIAKYLIAAARAMPEEKYEFRPSPDVRSFGQLVGHIAEAQYIACSLTRGEEYRPRRIEETVSKKAELVSALEMAVGFCRESWSKLKPAESITLFGQKRTQLGAMELATGHAYEHYGNMVTYLRMQGVVPPSSSQ
jgi:uncharacterized damage-inducible protein DinB/uncharacterized protein YciI